MSKNKKRRKYIECDDDDDEEIIPLKSHKDIDICDGKNHENRVRVIISIHTAAILLWIIIIVLMSLHSKKVIPIIILLIPFINFCLAIYNADKIVCRKESFNSNLLSLGLVIIIPLLTCLNKDSGPHRKKFITIAVLAIIFSLLTYIDYWVAPDDLYIITHIHSVFQTISLVLIIYALFCYYEIKHDFLIAEDI